MLFENKIYHDGSHYVAIPHTVGDHRKRPKRPEELVEIQEEAENTTSVENSEKTPYSPTSADNSNETAVENTNEEFNDFSLIKAVEEQKKTPEKPKKKATRSQIFNELYESCKDKTKSQMKNYLIKGMLPYFKERTEAKLFVENRLLRKKMNYYNRKKRFLRKANMNNFNYFVTFTYDDDLHTEDSFRKKLVKMLRNFQQRKDWRYMGVFERSPKGRLHFHGLLKIPDGTMPGELFEKEDYNLNTKRMQKTIQNTFFNSKFGRSDFEILSDNPRDRYDTYEYILKYVEKTGEKIVYSRKLPLYVIADIDEEDVLAKFDDESGKMVLYDKFMCFDEGEVIGEMSEAIKAKLRTSNI